MKRYLIIAMVFGSLHGFGQSVSDTLATVAYAGTYAVGKDIENELVGKAILYPETDTTVLFFISVFRATPYINGQHYGRLKIKNGQGTYFSKKIQI